jgi:hypothetical protein
MSTRVASEKAVWTSCLFSRFPSQKAIKSVDMRLPAPIRLCDLVVTGELS